MDGECRREVVIHTISEGKSETHALNNGIVNGNQIVVEVETNVPIYKTNGMIPNSQWVKISINFSCHKCKMACNMGWRWAKSLLQFSMKHRIEKIFYAWRAFSCNFYLLAMNLEIHDSAPPLVKFLGAPFTRFTWMNFSLFKKWQSGNVINSYVNLVVFML